MFPPPDVRRDLASRVPAARSAKWHITLAFLGDADPAGVASALAGRSFGPPFRLQIAGSGRFGPVVWAGVAGDLEALSALRTGVVSALAGFPVDAREYRPHLTLSYRFNRALLDDLSGYSGPSWDVPSFELIRSANGAYSPLAVVELRLPPRSRSSST